MKGGTRPNGYTIVEAMIFLAVSGLILVSALAVVSGQQNKTQFSQSIRDMQSKIDDVINDVATGYYAKSVDFDCSADDLGSPPILSGLGSSNQGSNAGCIFLGRVLQFAPNNNYDQMRIITVVGRQYKGAPLGPVVTSYSEAKPVALFPDDDTATETYDLEYGLKVDRMSCSKCSPRIIGAVGFFSSLSQYTNNASAGQSTQIVPIVNTDLGDSPAIVGTQISNAGAAVDSPITLCFISGGTNQHAIITIGGNQGRLTTTLEILDTDVC